MSYQYKRKDVLVRELDGTYKRKSIRAKSDKELTAKVNRITSEAEQRYQLTLCPLFSSVADEWNDKHRDEVAYNTWNGYQAPLKDLKSEFEGLHITEITPIMLQAVLNRMKSQGYARQTINLRKITASLIFDFAVVSGYVEQSPCIYLKTPKNAPHKARELPQAEDIERMLKAEGQFADFARFLYYTGMRKGEALALTWDDIKDGYIYVNKSLYWEGNEPKIKSTPKTISGVRKIPVLMPLKGFLSNKGNGIIFKGKNGSYLVRWEFMKGWAKFQKDNGINLSAHQLRHGFATLCYDANLDEKDAAELLGHSSVEITKDIYTHITAEREKVNADKLNAFLVSANSAAKNEKTA